MRGSTRQEIVGRPLTRRSSAGSPLPRGGLLVERRFASTVDRVRNVRKVCSWAHSIAEVDWAACGSPAPVNNRLSMAGLAGWRKPARQSMSEVGSGWQNPRHQWRPSFPGQLVKFSTWKSQLREQSGSGGKLARARRWLRSAGKDSSAEDASALGSGSGGALSAERGLRGTGQLVSPRRASGMARTTGRRRIGRLVRPTAGRRNRERQWRVSTGSRFTVEQTGVDFDRAMGARSTLANLVFVKGTAEQATARGGGTNRSVTRGRGNFRRKAEVKRRRSGMWHFATRTSVRSSRSAQEAAVRRV